MLRRRLLIGLAGLGLLWACNDHDPHPPNLTDPGGSSVGGAGGSGGGSSTATRDAGVLDSGTSGALDAGECTDLDDPTTRIDENNLSDTAPPGAGGDLTAINATYDLQTASKYVGATGLAGPNGVTYREIIRISAGNAFERHRVVQQNNGPEQIVNATYALQASGTTLSLTQQCPSQGGSEAYSFTLQDGRLTLINALGESFTYVARP
jgi:hypothetical protein